MQHIYFICNLIYPCNCLGGWSFCIFLLSFFGLTSAKEVLSMSRYKNESFLRQNKTKKKSFVLTSGILGLNMNMWTCRRSKIFKTHQMEKIVQHHQNISNPLTDHLKVCAFFNALLYQNHCKSNSPAAIMSKRKLGKWAPKLKVNGTSTKPKPSTIQNIFRILSNTIENSLSWESKLIKTIHLSNKRQNLVAFLN